MAKNKRQAVATLIRELEKPRDELKLKVDRRTWKQEAMEAHVQDQQHDSSGFTENVQIVKGKTPDVVSNFVRDNAVDLVVMGTVARSGLTGLLMGNTSESVLDQINCSVLAVKPYSFKTSIQV